MFCLFYFLILHPVVGSMVQLIEHIPPVLRFHNRYLPFAYTSKMCSHCCYQWFTTHFIQYCRSIYLQNGSVSKVSKQSVTSVVSSPISQTNVYWFFVLSTHNKLLLFTSQSVNHSFDRITFFLNMLQIVMFLVWSLVPPFMII